MACCCCCRLICAGLSKPRTVSAVWEALRPTWRGFYKLNWKHHQMSATVPLQGVQDGRRADSNVGDEHEVQLDLHVLVFVDRDCRGGTILSLPMAITGTWNYFWLKQMLQVNPQVAEFGGTLGLFIGFNFISLWDTTASCFCFIKHLWDGKFTTK